MATKLVPCLNLDKWTDETGASADAPHGHDVRGGDMPSLFRKFDSNGNGELTMDEFCVTWCNALPSNTLVSHVLI